MLLQSGEPIENQNRVKRLVNVTRRVAFRCSDFSRDLISLRAGCSRITLDRFRRFTLLIV